MSSRAPHPCAGGDEFFLRFCPLLGGFFLPGEMRRYDRFTLQSGHKLFKDGGPVCAKCGRSVAPFVRGWLVAEKQRKSCPIEGTGALAERFFICLTPKTTITVLTNNRQEFFKVFHL
jgi:hypothetical protein